ncbi:MAG: acyl-CoA dehydrogenase family protein, partial [Gammaproteobacteria bacterium]
MSESIISTAELRDTVRGVLSVESASKKLRAALDGPGSLREALWPTVADLGWAALAIPEEHGGMGLGSAELAVVFEELGRYLTPVPFLSTMLFARAVAAAGTPDQRAALLPKVAAGELIGAISPPDQRPALVLVADGDRIRLRGTAAAVLDADAADAILVLAEDQRRRRMLVLVQPSDGVAARHRPTFDRTRRLCDLAFDDLALPADRILGGGVLDPVVEGELLSFAALAMACDSIAGAAHILEQTVEYMKTRQQFGRVIGSFQQMKARAANLKTLLEAASALTRQAVSQHATGAADRDLWCSNAKYMACDAYKRIAEDAVQLHGGIGFTWEHDCHLFLKRARL